MLLIDLIVGWSVPAVIGAAIVQATTGLQRGDWLKEDGDDVIPLAVPDGVWVDLDTGVLGVVSLGTYEGSPALRLPSALAFVARRSLAVSRTTMDGALTVLVLNVAGTVWLPLPGLRIGVRRVV